MSTEYSEHEPAADAPGAREPEEHQIRYVALGDSFTEGVGDEDASRPNGVRGWADRVAEQLTLRFPQTLYANLAIRGRTLEPILAEQVDAALALRPTLVSLYGGGNDILRPSIDVDALMADYDEAFGRLRASGAQVLTLTGAAPVILGGIVLRHLLSRTALVPLLQLGLILVLVIAGL